MLRLLSIFLLLVASMWAEEPFQFEKTPGRLPKTVVPEHYEIRVDPDLEAARFTGEVRIRVKAASAVDEIVLNSMGLRMTKGLVDGQAVTATANDETQLLQLKGDGQFAAGEHHIELHFSGNLTEKPQGLYLTRYQLPNGQQRKALVTQMEATDARRVFPCWDEPVFRATYQLTAVIPAGHTALSNMPEQAVKTLADGRREVAFQPSPRMSSYLVALASAELEVIEDESDGTKLRIFATPGKREQMRYAMETTKKVLPFFNDYFGARYPLPKLDQVSFPSVAASGMENWGCIIYSDTAMLFDETSSSQNTRERVFEIVAHEIAHQWFGDLVTMAWWDNLWLNEGFASWMATKAADTFNPKWKKWLRAASGKETAMRLDARSTTHPIQQPVLSEADAMQAFDEITYQKGQAFLRMLENWLGEDGFREGLRAYFKRHAYGSTTTADLWTALEEASGQEVRAMAAGWTEQPGFPVISVKDDGISQGRFTIHQQTPAPLAWQIPIAWERWPGADRGKLLLGNEARSLMPRPEPLLLHPVGYYRVFYEGAAWESLAPELNKLGESDRLAIAQDTWALAQAGRVPLTRWLEVAAQLRGDPSPTVGAHLVEVLNAIDHLTRGSEIREPFRAWARKFLAARFTKIGWDSSSEEEPAVASHRAALISTLGRFGDADIRTAAKQRLEKFLNDPTSLPADLREPVLHLSGRDADETLWEQLHHLGKGTPNTEQKILFYGALVAAQNPALAKRALALSLAGELPAKIATRLIGRVASEGENPEAAWEFAKAKLPELLAMMSAMGADEFVPYLFRNFTEASRASELETFVKENLPPTAARPAAIAVDEIRFKAEFKTRALPEIARWLQSGK